ncbi:MAG: 4Fe-4S binding protein [Terracidiphilus sp.]
MRLHPGRCIHCRICEAICPAIVKRKLRAKL